MCHVCCYCFLKIHAFIFLCAIKVAVVLHHHNSEEKFDPNKNRKSKSKKSEFKIL